MVTFKTESRGFDTSRDLAVRRPSAYTPFTQGLWPLRRPCATTKLAFFVPQLCLLWPTNGVHWVITVANTVPPFSDHGNPWATMVLRPLCLLCATCCATQHFEGSRNVQGSCCSSYTATGLSGFWRPLNVLIIFWSLKGGTKVAALCKVSFSKQRPRINAQWCRRPHTGSHKCTTSCEHKGHKGRLRIGDNHSIISGSSCLEIRSIDAEKYAGCKIDKNRIDHILKSAERKYCQVRLCEYKSNLKRN